MSIQERESNEDPGRIAGRDGTEGPEAPEGPGGRRRWRSWRGRTRTLAALVAVFVLGAASGGALIATSDAWSHWGGGRWGGGAKWGHGDPERMKERVLDRSARWLGRVDATDAQRDAVQGIIGEAADDFAATIEEHRGLRREWLTELARPELDAEALEALRVQHLGMMDEKSRRALDAVLRIAAELTAEQRNDLLDDFARHRGRHHAWRNRRHGGKES